jgi:prevent-host-death family protein
MVATAKDLRFHVKEILESTMRGEEVIITYRGEPTAKVIPFSDSKNKAMEIAEDNLFGIWKDRTETGNVDEYVRKMRKGRVF